MQLLENSSSEANSCDNHCSTSILAVASTLASQFIKHELSHEIHKDFERKIGQISLLYWAVLCGHTAVARVLIEMGADIDVKYRDGWTALHYAALNGHEAVVRHLLEVKADIDAKDRNI